MSALNIYIGMRFFLNVIHVLDTSKYSKSATLIYAILFLGLGILGLYFAIIKSNTKLGLWIGVGPWVCGLIVLLITMLTSPYK